MDRLSCFIALALGKKDVNEIYKNSFEVVLNDLNIEPNRVDIIEHNEDIDDKIIEIIYSCDFCIADLTYARPSVYYEAGYFTGLKKPVIYTSRSDHFIPNSNDIHGNQKIHFDLQMKNIITWNSTQKVKTLNNKLKKRILLVTEPLKQNLEELQKRQKAIEDFKWLSQTNKLKSLQNLIIRKLKSSRWKRVEYDTNAYPKPDNYQAYKNGREIIAIFITNTATKEYLKYIKKERIVYQLRRYNKSDNSIFQIFIISLRKVPITRIDDNYPEHELIDEAKCTYQAGKVDNNVCYFHIISEIRSELEFESIINEKLKEINKLK